MPMTEKHKHFPAGIQHTRLLWVQDQTEAAEQMI
jgi:hypothetical protein